MEITELGDDENFSKFGHYMYKYLLRVMNMLRNVEILSWLYLWAILQLIWVTYKVTRTKFLAGDKETVDKLYS